MLTFQRRATANVSAGSGIKLNVTPCCAVLHEPFSVQCRREKVAGFRMQIVAHI